MKFWQRLKSLAAARRGNRTAAAKRNRRAHFEPLEARLPLAADITTGLVHHWTFDETSGDTAADVAGGSNGTLFNWAASEPKWEPGRVGGALRFDTADNRVVAQPPAMSGSYSVSFWINVKDRSGVNPRIFQSRAGNDIFVNMTNNRSVGFSSNNTNTFQPEPPAFNVWEHYAVKFNAASGQGVVYRSGAPVAIGTFVDSASLSSWVIGHSTNPANSNDTLKGAIDDLRVYGRLLTDEDIAALASMGIPELVHLAPVHHWTFDETSGFTAHDVPGGADGTLLNWNQTEPRWAAGKVGGALRFSTVDNAVVTPALGTGAQWSIAFWLQVSAKTGLNPRIMTGPDTGTWAYLNLENDRGMSFSSRNTNTHDPAPVTVGTWVHYAVTFDTIGDVGAIFRDGKPVASGFFGDNAPAVPWIFGHNSDLDNPLGSLDGLLDDLRVYDRLLSTSEIQALAAQSTPQPPTNGLIHFWTFDETNGNTATDSVGSNDGELRNYGPLQDKWVPGKIGGAISFTDADDLVITESPITEDKYTFAFWLNQTGGGGFNPRLINPGDEDWLVLWQFADRGIHFSGSGVWDSQMATRNTWEHYAVTLDQTTNRVEFYRSGLLVASGNYPDKPPPIKQWVMGHSGTLTHHVDTLHGMLDEMRVYDRVLSAAEVQLIAQFQPLEARPDAYSTREDLALVVSAGLGLKKNDNSTSARVVAEVLPANGQLTLNEDGSFTYTPTKDFNGTDTFTYHLVNAQETSEPATVTLNVNTVNDPPSFLVSVPEFVISDEHPRVFRQNGQAVPSFNLPELLRDRVPGPATATDEVSQSLTWSATTDNPEIFADEPSVDHRGTVTFTPAPNASGTAVVTVKVQDNGGTADGGIDTTLKTFVVTVVKPHPLLNVVNPLDPTDDGFVVAGDVLEVINFINAFGAQSVEQALAHDPRLLDVTGDNFIAAGDALAIINAINAEGATLPAPSTAATFIELDQTTQGNWPAKYGSQGYSINSSLTKLPSYAEVSFTGGATDLYDYIVASSTSDPTQLIKPGTSERIHSTWTGDHGFTLNVSLTDGQAHRVALYMVEGGPDLHQMLEVLNAETGELLDSRTLDDFTSGTYLVWNLRGNVKIRFTNLANGHNAALSGIFFD